MNANIEAILDLFPQRSGPATYSDVASLPTIPGRCPYDKLKAVDGLTPELVNVVDAVRAHTRWGPVFAGDLTGHGGDHSAADLALCGELARRGLNPGCIDTALRASGLYRDKWERGDYRDRTIAKALTNLQLTKPTAASNTGNAKVNLLDPKNGRVTISTTPPAPRVYALDGHLVPGKSAVLAGFGGVSKTQLALQLSTAIALGEPFMGRTTKPGKVIVILGEEDRSEVDRRLSAIARHHQLSGAEIATLQSNILAFPLVGHDVRLTVPIKGGLSETKFAEAVVAVAAEFGDVRLIVLDHLALLHGGDFNAREAAALTMRVVNHIAQETGASVLVLAHTPKSANQQEASDASMVAGSTAFVDQARAAWVMSAMRKGEAKHFGVSAAARKVYVSLTVVKNNYGPTGDVEWFIRTPADGVGLLEHVALIKPSAAKAATDLAKRVVEFVGHHPGQFSKTKLRDRHSGATKIPLKASKGDVENVLEELLNDGRLIARPPTDEECERFGHGRGVKFVLDLGAA